MPAGESSQKNKLHPAAQAAPPPAPLPSNFSSGARKLLFEWEQKEEAPASTETARQPVRVPALKKFSVSVSSSSERDWVYFTVLFQGSVSPATVTDLYIDINHRPGAGTAALIAGRNATVEDSDAWELLLISRWVPARGWTASLYRSPAMAPVIYSTAIQYKTQSRPGTATFQIRVPKNLLGENPAHWGFLLCTAGWNGPVTDFLSSTMDKERLLEEIKNGGAVRLPMIRDEAAVEQGAER